MLAKRLQATKETPEAPSLPPAASAGAKNEEGNNRAVAVRDLITGRITYNTVKSTGVVA